MIAHFNDLVQAALSGSHAQFWVKWICIDFLEEKYMLFKKKDVSNFSCRINIILTSQSNIPFFVK